jgi:SAM-dependent methyltransferase
MPVVPLIKQLPFDGERVVPENYRNNRLLFYYHWARYTYAKSFLTRGDAVVDVACGSGYGTYELAAIAGQVIGVDLSEDAINYARARFASGNIKYLIGDASKIDSIVLERVDAVVSFETIEHLESSAQRLFVRGVASRLADKGVFIVSTPNTLIYSQGKPTTNRFHAHELAPDEFKVLLEEYFEVVLLFGQRKFSGSTAKGISLLAANFVFSFLRGAWRGFKFTGDLSQQISDFEFTNIGIEECPFLMAICKRPRVSTALSH